MTLTPAAAGVLTLTVSDTGPINWMLASLAEQGSAATPTPIGLSSSGGVSQALFSLPLTSMTGYLYLRADGGRETILSFSMTDGSPSIHDTAHSPRADAQLERRGTAAAHPVVLWDARGLGKHGRQRRDRGAVRHRS